MPAPLFKLPQPLRDLDVLLTPQQFAEWVGGGATERWALDQARTEKIPSVKLGREVRFHPRTVLEKCAKNHLN